MKRREACYAAHKDDADGPYEGDRETEDQEIGPIYVDADQLRPPGILPHGQSGLPSAGAFQE